MGSAVWKYFVGLIMNSQAFQKWEDHGGNQAECQRKAESADILTGTGEGKKLMQAGERISAEDSRDGQKEKTQIQNEKKPAALNVTAFICIRPVFESGHYQARKQ